jgi:hypothetical protein
MYRHTISPTGHINLNVVVHTKSHWFSLLLTNLFASIPCYLHHTIFFLTMFGEADQSSNATGEISAASTESAAATGSEAPSSTSYSTMDN